MDKNTLCESLIKWLQTFKNISAPHHTVDDLANGVAMAEVLNQVDSDWFDKFWMSKIKSDVKVDNWRLKVSNLKKIVEHAVDYYQEHAVEVQAQQFMNFKLPDLNAIAEHSDGSELGRLLQLILGCAVNCDHKEEYIEIIMRMEEADQHEVMNAIQELMTPAPSQPIGDTTPDVDQLKSMKEANDELTKRCHELDDQVVTLQGDKTTLQMENEKLIQKVEGYDDTRRKYQQLQLQVEPLKEEAYKLETSRDEYRIKVEDLEKATADLQHKNEELQRIAEEARVLKDEIDVLREMADKATKYESTLEVYKKKLEDMSDLKRQVKMLEEKNEQLMQSNMEIEEEAKKGGSLKSHIEIYKKQVQELHKQLTDETKKADKSEFENKKLQERLDTLQQERQRIVAERDTLKETNEELRLTLLQIENANNSPEHGHAQSMSDSEMLEIIPPEVKEKLIRLQHENKMLKLDRQGHNEERLQVVQSMLDDALLRESELQTENRLANQRLLELESQLDDVQKNQSDSRNQEGVEVRRKMSSMLCKIKEYESELQKKATLQTDIEAQLSERDKQMQDMQESLNRNEDEMKRMEEKYQKYLDKAKTIIRSLDPKNTNAGAPPEIVILRNQLQEKAKHIENLERDTEQSRAIRDMEERLITSAFYCLGKQLQRKAAEDRLAQANAGQTFLSRQRQATSRKLGLGISQRLWNRSAH